MFVDSINIRPTTRSRIVMVINRTFLRYGEAS